MLLQLWHGNTEGDADAGHGVGSLNAERRLRVWWALTLGGFVSGLWLVFASLVVLLVFFRLELPVGLLAFLPYALIGVSVATVSELRRRKLVAEARAAGIELRIVPQQTRQHLWREEDPFARIGVILAAVFGCMLLVSLIVLDNVLGAQLIAFGPLPASLGVYLYGWYRDRRKDRQST